MRRNIIGLPTQSAPAQGKTSFTNFTQRGTVANEYSWQLKIETIHLSNNKKLLLIFTARANISCKKKWTMPYLSKDWIGTSANSTII